MELFFGIVLGLVALVALVVLHELGHAIVARRNGVVVEEFGIGFPPRAWKKKLKNGIVFSLNWLPLGGFVKLQGEHDSARKKGDYGAATFWQKTKILLAGVVANWLVAVLLFTVLALTGLPKIIPHQFSVAGDTQTVTQPVQITALVDDYPAKAAGFLAGDKVISLNGERVETVSRFIELTREHRGQTVAVTYERDGAVKEVDVPLRDASEGSVFGAGLGQGERLRATWSAPIVGVVTTAQFTWETLKGIGTLVGQAVGGLVAQLSGDETTRQKGSESLAQAGESVAGPIGILGVIFPQAGQAGLTEVVFLIAIISLTLAVMNTLPIPALDGGRWFVTAIFRALKRPLTKEREEAIQGTGFLVLMALIVLITVLDVGKLFR